MPGLPSFFPWPTPTAQEVLRAGYVSAAATTAADSAIKAAAAKARATAGPQTTEGATTEAASKAATEAAKAAIGRFSFVTQLALQCLEWQCSYPTTNGELAWEELFVGPLVTAAFRRLFRRGSGLTWTG